MNLLAAILTLVTQFSVMVKTPAGIQTYDENPNQTVPIELPTDRFQCVRRPIQQDGNKMLILVTCEEDGKPAVGFIGVCRTDQPDENISGGSINLAKPGEDPIPGTFIIKCRTVPNNTVL